MEGAKSEKKKESLRRPVPAASKPKVPVSSGPGLFGGDEESDDDDIFTIPIKKKGSFAPVQTKKAEKISTPVVGASRIGDLFQDDESEEEPLPSKRSLEDKVKRFAQFLGFSLVVIGFFFSYVRVTYRKACHYAV